MRTSGTGYVNLKKKEWIYAKLASQIAALSIFVAKLSLLRSGAMAPLDDCKYWADEIVLYKL